MIVNGPTPVASHMWHRMLTCGVAVGVHRPVPMLRRPRLPPNSRPSSLGGGVHNSGGRMFARQSLPSTRRLCVPVRPPISPSSVEASADAAAPQPAGVAG